MRLLAPDHAEALTDPQTWSDNPFVAREARRDRKRRQPTKAFAWMAGTLLVFLGLALWLLHWLLFSWGRGVPWFLGGDVGTMLCIVLSGIHIWYIAGAAQKTSLLLLTQESYRNTLPGLLMLPLSPFHLLLQAGVYPWLAGMRAALALLPVYVFLVGLDGISWADLGMLYLVFALTSVSFPVWRRPALSDNVLIVAPTQAAATAATGAFGAATTQQQTTATAGSGGGNVMGGISALAFIVPMFAMVFSLAQRRGFSGTHAMLHHYLPDSLILLMPSSMLSWPLLTARALITPLDWYGLPLPPLGFALVGFVLSRYTQIVRTAEFLSVGTYRDLAQLPTYLPRRRLEGRLRIGQILVVVGYLWRWGVGNGGLAFLASNVGRSSASGLAGFAYLLLIIAAWRGLWRGGALGGWLRPRRKQAETPVVRQVQWPTAARFLAEPFLFAVGFYLACCLLSRTAPFPPSLGPLAGEMLAIGLAGVLLSLGTERAFGPLAVLARLTPIGVIIGILYYHIASLRPLLYLSPLVGLVYVGNPGLVGLGGLFQPPPHWWLWPLNCGLAGVFLWLCGRATTRSAAATADSPPLALDPVRYGAEVFSDPVVAARTTTAQTDTPLAQRLIAGIQRLVDNAVLTRELRARLRGKLDIGTIRATFLIYLIASLALYQGLPAVAEAFGGGLARAFYGPISRPEVLTAASILCCWYLLLLFRAFLAGFVTFQAFLPEIQKSTLGFLLMTPMRASAIIFGKAVGMMLPGNLFTLSAGLWTLAFSLALLPALGGVTLAVWVMVMLSAFLVQMTVGMAMLAVASLFSRLNPQYGGCVVAILIQVFIQGTIQLGRFIPGLLSRLDDLMGLSGVALWLLLIGICLLLTALFTLIAIWGVRRMRKRDLTFAASKREN